VGALFRRSGEGFVALEGTVGPWDPRMQSGVALCGVMAQALEAQPTLAPMAFARFHLDILRPVPIGAFRVACAPIKDGPRMQLLEAQLVMEGEVLARAYGLRLRFAETPSMAISPPATQPEMFEPNFKPSRGGVGSITDRRNVLGGGRDHLGPAAAWIRFEGDLVEGEALSPFVAAAMLCDFGSGISSVLPWREYTWANVDVSMNLVRTPRGPWLLVEAETVTHGEGRALTNVILSDRAGEFARAHQNLFVDPRPPRPQALVRIGARPGAEKRRTPSSIRAKRRARRSAR